MSTPRPVTATLLALLLAALVAVAVPLLRPVPWSATVPVQLQPAGDPAATPYVDDVLSRPVVTATFAAILADPGFLRDAADRLGMGRSRTRAAEVTVRQAGGSAVLFLTVTGRQRDEAAALAPAVVAEAIRYVEDLRTLYALRPAVPGHPPQVERPARYGSSTVVLLVAALLPAWLLSWWLLGSRARRTDLQGVP